MDLRTIVGPTDHITAPGSDYDEYLGQEFSWNGKNYRIVQNGTAAITSGAKLFVRGGIADNVALPANDGDPVIGIVPADIDTTNVAASAVFCVITKGSVVVKKATTESFAANARLEATSTGMVTAAYAGSTGSSSTIIGLALAAAAASVTSVATFISL